MAAIGDSAFVISTNGFVDGPAQALRDYLVRAGAGTLTFVAHPLDRDSGSRHVVSTYEGGRLNGERRVVVPSRPPATFPLDLVVPLRLPPCDAWFGFNNLACLRGLIRRRFGRAGEVFYWAVDFVPDRFGQGALTSVYDRLDRTVCVLANGRIELSEAALAGRNDRLRLNRAEVAPAFVAPMGAWLDRVPTVDSGAWKRRRVVFLGHLVERQGVTTLLQALATLTDVQADIVGTGPLEQDLRREARALGIEQRVVFHGFVEDHAEVERILARGTVAVAPYVERDDNFTRYADPGKLKAYLAAGLPVILTAVPPNAGEISAAGAGKLVNGTPEAVAGGIAALLATEREWRVASSAAADFAKRYDWNAILAGLLARLGYD